MIPTLNWRELEILVSKLRPEIEGLFVDRMIVADRAQFPEGYLKGEWVLRLTGRKNEGFLLFSIRPRQPYLTWSQGKGPKASPKGTRSPFDLSLSKHLKGAKLLEIQALHRERIIVIWFSEEGRSDQRLGLVLVFIPAAPEAFLVNAPLNSSAVPEWPILARSRTIRDEAKQEFVFRPPNGLQAPENPPVREELFKSAESFYQKVESELKGEAFTLRLQAAHKGIRQLLKQAQDRLRQSQTALREAENEEDWQRLGDLLKSSLHNPPPLVNSVRKVMDYESEKEVSIACDPKLSLKEQVEKFYQNSRRKQRRHQEASSRIERFREVSERLEKALNEKPDLTDWPGLEKLEKISGSGVSASTAASEGKSSKKGSAATWLGKTFTSKDGLVIWVGRNKDENLELTFKHARGNDLWLHVRGRPGAHAIIPLQSGKSAPLETLLDAANLVIYYSGGEKWGKTEVDYTFKKYVKRIKDSSEANYINNKTLLIQPDLVRIKKLLDQQGL